MKLHQEIERLERFSKTSTDPEILIGLKMRVIMAMGPEHLEAHRDSTGKLDEEAAVAERRRAQQAIRAADAALQAGRRQPDQPFPFLIRQLDKEVGLGFLDDWSAPERTYYRAHSLDFRSTPEGAANIGVRIVIDETRDGKDQMALADIKLSRQDCIWLRAWLTDVIAYGSRKT